MGRMDTAAYNKRYGIICFLFRLSRKGREKEQIKISGIMAVLRPLYHKSRPASTRPGQKDKNQSRVASTQEDHPALVERESGTGYRMRTRMMPGTAARSFCRVSGTAPVASSMV